jgi:anti-sigma B factor antagonist
MTTFEVDRSDARIGVIRPVGRLNMASAPQLSTMITDIVADGCSHLILDLSGTEFIDSSGLGALVASLKRCRQAGGDLRLAAPTPQVTTALELTNLDRVLRPSETVSDARALV